MKERVIEIRKAYKLSQMEFAQKLGFTQSNLSLIELGKIPITEANIKLICFTFGIRELWLRTGEGAMRDEEKVFSEHEKRLINLYLKLSVTAQRMVIEYAEKLFSDELTLKKIAATDEKGSHPIQD